MRSTPSRGEGVVQQCRDRKRLARVARLLEWGCYAALVLSLFGLLGGWDSLRSRTNLSDLDGAWLTFPINLAYWLPLLIPFTTYVVIARWTGDTMFRHS